ncbi:MAG: RNA polymerase sigma factor [Bacilli bacterium]|nr:RNA polymerase sigma factor [Bacilli bacterium]
MKISEEKFNYIYDKFLQELFNVAYGYTKNVDDSNDIVHNSFVKLLKANISLETDNDIKYYLIRIVINESIDFLKSSYKKSTIRDNELIMNTSDSIDDDSFENINYAVSILPEKYKTVIILHYYNLMKIDEIAEVLNISDSAVKKRLERARKKLKESLEGNE